MFEGLNCWYAVKDGDLRALGLMKNHYSYQPYKDGRRKDWTNPNRNLFVGPGEKMVLLTSDCLALFVWRKFIDKSGWDGVNCSVFHNAGPHLSSELILEAEKLAWDHWPGQLLYTYVNPEKIKSANPGYCFKCAGWKFAGITISRQLHVLEKWPAAEGGKNGDFL